MTEEIERMTERMKEEIKRIRIQKREKRKRVKIITCFNASRADLNRWW